MNNSIKMKNVEEYIVYTRFNSYKLISDKK